MKSESDSRKRAVRLSAEGYEVLVAGLEERRRASGGNLKLTRAVRAELMGISERTTDFVLARKGVDRSTLKHAFSTLQIEWRDDYYETFESLDPLELPETRNATALPRIPWRRVAYAILPIIILVIAIAAWLKFASMHAFPKVSNSEFEVAQSEFVRTFKTTEEHYHKARYREAGESAQRLIKIARKHQHAGWLSGALRLLGDVKAAVGELREAKVLYEEAIDLRLKLQDYGSTGAIYEALATVEARLGDFGPAKAHFRQGIDSFSQIENRAGIAECQRGLGSICYKNEDWDSALSWFASAKESLKGLPQEAMIVDLESREALVLRETGKPREAKEKLERCLAYWQKHGHRRWIASSKARLASVELMLENPQRAEQLLKESHEGYAAVGDAAGKSETEQLLRQMGIRLAGSKSALGHSSTFAR